MWDVLGAYWPHLTLVFSSLCAVIGVVHVVMTKDDVRAAIGWSGVILLSPVLGALVYAVVGVNRMRRQSFAGRRRRSHAHEDVHLSRFDVPHAVVKSRFGPGFAALKILGDRTAHRAMTSGNSIEPLEGGDLAYGAMLEAIGQARRSVLLESYIFDSDRIGQRFVAALAAAKARGVEVRVLVDGTGVRYSRPRITRLLSKAGLTSSLFNRQSLFVPRLQYANLRTHRKVLVVDGAEAFMGGMNIREGFTSEFAGEDRGLDMHFRLRGPVVADLFAIAADDWSFTTGESLDGPAWRIALPVPELPDAPAFARAVASGPDGSIETNHRLLLGAIAGAERSIRIMSPYFIPDRDLISALGTAARRGVEVDIVVPDRLNIPFIGKAMRAQYPAILETGCHIWRFTESFDHSKLFVVDGTWAFVGSSNLDPRSMRLNFEIDLEVLDADFAGGIDAHILAMREGALPTSATELQARPFIRRLSERLVWLASPYL